MAKQNTTGKKSNVKIAVNPEFEHLQPQVVEMEKKVLAALMIDRDAYAMVNDQISADMFYDPRHKKIFEAIFALNIAEKPVDLVTVTEELRHQGTFDEIGMDYLLEIDDSAATSANIVYHVKVINEKFLARQLISYSSVVQTKAFDATNDVNEVMQEAEASLFQISQKNKKADFVHVAPVVKAAQDLLLKAAANQGGLTGIPTGYAKLDDMTAGWQKSDLVIIAARPAMGKTAFALSLARNIAVDYNRPVGFFSLEMSNVQLVNRLIANVCEIDSKKILNGQLDDMEWKQFDNNISRLSDAPIYLDDTPGMSIFELRTKARRMVREHGVEILMIDYLQLMNANGAKFGSRQEEVSTISRSLKGLAKELDIPVIALSQLNRDVEKRDNNPDSGVDSHIPQMSDLRESGAIEQDADMIIFIHRPEYYRIYQDSHGNDTRGKAQIVIAKHRKGATGDVFLDFKGQFTKFQDPVSGNSAPRNTFEGEIVGSKSNDFNGGAPMPPIEGDPFADTSINDILDGGAVPY
ncbi:MAG: replicative DNA helicase [Bacteroidaceae bacterium]|nr:replicative DNA helicase [Bacteroidaceae bacterium]